MTRRLRDNDDGVTMMELVVYSVLSIFVLIIVGSLVINGLRGQQSVNAITTATTSGQLAASTIQADVRNATALRITTVGDDQLVIGRVARGNDATVVWRCVAWYYSASKKEIRTTSSAGAIGTPTATALKTWTLIANKVKPVGTVVFSGDANQLSMTFTVDAGTTKAVPIKSSATSRNQTGVGTPCF